MDAHADTTSPAANAPGRQWWRVGLGAGLAFLVVLAGLAAAFLWGVAIPGEFLRAPLERALSAAFGVPTRIEGPLRVRTGLVATATADALVLGDPFGPAGATLARGTRPGVRIDLAALLRRSVALDEVTGERLELTLRRAADGRANWAPIFAASPDGGPPPVTFAGIARLRIDTVSGGYRSEGAAPVRFAIASLDGALPLRDPTTARGTAQVVGYTIAFDLRAASLAGLKSAGAAIPVQGTLGWSGARMAIDGGIARDGSKLDAGVQISADDASQLLAALGAAAHDPGRLEARGKLSISASEAVASELALTLGQGAVSGSARVAWGTPRPHLAFDVAGERVDLDPFISAEPSATDKTAAEALVDLIEGVAVGTDAEVKLAVGELTGLPVTLRELKLEGRSGDQVVAVRGDAVIAGTRAKATLDYDARKPQRVLSARVEGGAVSTARLPRGEGPQALSGTTAGMRGQIRGLGGNPRAIVASLQGSLDARDLRWTLAGRKGQPVSGRFDTVHVAVQGTRTSSATVAGKLGDVACTLRASGGALAPLLEGEQWPVQLAGSCGGGRLSAKGRIAVAERHVAAQLAFDAVADRIGPVARALGVVPDAPHRFAARGSLSLDEKLAHARLDSIRLGRTAGSGEVDLPLGGEGAPRVRLALATLNLDEINSLAGAGPVPSDPLERAVFRENLRLPDADFAIAADRVQVADSVLRLLHLSGAMRASKLPRAPFAFEWDGARVSGTLAADFSGALPRLHLDGAAQNANLGALLARFGLEGVGLRAGTLSLRAGAEGERLGALLASATLDAKIERGRLDLAQRPARGLSGRGDFAATLKAVPGQPAALTANGTMGGEPFDLSLDTPGLAGLVRPAGAIPATLRATLGDARLQAAGQIARDATGEGRVQLSGGRLDRLGKLIGVELPAVGPYAANGTIVVATDAIRASNLDVSLGRSRVLGHAQMQVKRGSRPLHSLALRAPALHLEDLGAARWLAPAAPPKDGEAAVARREEALLAHAIELVRAADVDATLEVDALHGGGERFASGRLRVTLDAGALQLLLQDARTEGGRIDADVGIDATGPQPKLRAHARVEGMDFGPLARTLDPATKLGGRLDLLADLAAQGPPGQLLPALAGTIDVAIFPHDLRPGALAFWGTGLLSAMLRTLDPSARSEVECAIASFDVDTGIARSEAFFVDTTRVRIIGQIDADLTTHELSGRLRPVSEQPQLFSVAPTMLLGGTIEAPRVTIAPENIVLAPLRFATPLSGFALDWLSGQGKMRESAAGCREAFDRARKARGIPDSGVRR
ncbi:MAG TPA: AsmA-like C-terminal region-containing protein [Burkholderiales bacterium]|nr:AsmA-like C-terminal region-containing protein [Burkholderiales bacterium]